ncbi:MAG: 30S ribosomal protein S6 [Chloroflexi bacterium HGW-Chloroflexi-8]|jgi:small subunit ribosomal protein S6|nr:MAG: 30S ribosomal protein S6 [Chloroflexi bacterium HGW-Chloroflexi-8]
MRNYELLVVLQPDLDETALNEILTKINNWVTEAGGKVEKTDNWGKRRMAYHIRKQREGLYVLFLLNMLPSVTNDLERNLRFLEPVMRHMITLAE